MYNIVKNEKDTMYLWYRKIKTSIKMIKRVFFSKIWQTLQTLEMINLKILNFKFLTGNTSFLTPIKEVQTSFSLSCLVCATELTQHMEKSNGWPLIYFGEYTRLQVPIKPLMWIRLVCVQPGQKKPINTGFWVPRLKYS